MASPVLEDISECELSTTQIAVVRLCSPIIRSHLGVSFSLSCWPTRILSESPPSHLPFPSLYNLLPVLIETWIIFGVSYTFCAAGLPNESVLLFIRLSFSQYGYKAETWLATGSPKFICLTSSWWCFCRKGERKKDLMYQIRCLTNAASRVLHVSGRGTSRCPVSYNKADTPR